MYLYIFQGQDCLYTQRVDDQSVIGVLEYNGGTDRNSTLSDGWNVSGNAIVYGEKQSVRFRMLMMMQIP